MPKKKSDRLVVEVAGRQTGRPSNVVVITPKYDKDGKWIKDSWLDAETFEVVKLKQEIAELKAKLEELKNPTPEEPAEPKLRHVEVVEQGSGDVAIIQTVASRHKRKPWTKEGKWEEEGGE